MNYYLTNPQTKQPDPMLTLVVFTVVVCGLKFLFEGVTFTIFGHSFNLGHADATMYAAMLAPVLGAHGYMSGNGSTTPPPAGTP